MSKSTSLCRVVAILLLLSSLTRTIRQTTVGVMNAMHKLINFGDPAVTAIPHVATMAVGALVVGWLGTRWFRYQ
jgi:hypothetical protein